MISSHDQVFKLLEKEGNNQEMKRIGLYFCPVFFFFFFLCGGGTFPQLVEVCSTSTSGDKKTRVGQVNENVFLFFFFLSLEGSEKTMVRSQVALEKWTHSSFLSVFLFLRDFSSFNYFVICLLGRIAIRLRVKSQLGATGIFVGWPLLFIF